jgi:hypothetical protein
LNSKKVQNSIDISFYCCYSKKVGSIRFLASMFLPVAQRVKFTVAGVKNVHQLNGADLQNLSEDGGLSRPALKP